MTKPQQLRLHVSPELPFAFEPIERDQALADLVNAFFVVRTEHDRLVDRLPAYSAQFLVFVKGEGEIYPDQGASFPLAGVCCTTPQLRACEFSLDGPAFIIGASLTPLGWLALSNMPVDKVNNRTVFGSQLLPEADLARLRDLAASCGHGQSAPQDLCALIGQLLVSRRENLNSTHVRFVEKVTTWLSSDLSPSVADLYASLNMSDRTAQRLCRRYFGVSPSHLVKRYRAIRAAMMLANPQLPQSTRDEIQSAYFDQAHLIRDIRRYTGRTPREFSQQSLATETLDPDVHGETAKVLR